MVLTIVATPVFGDMPQRAHAFVQERLAGVVLIADDVAEFVGMFHQIADAAHVAAHRIGADNADAIKPGAIDGLKILAEQLI